MSQSGSFLALAQRSQPQGLARPLQPLLMAEFALRGMVLLFGSYLPCSAAVRSSRAGEPQGQLEVGLDSLQGLLLRAILGQKSSSEGSCWKGRMDAMYGEPGACIRPREREE